MVDSDPVETMTYRFAVWGRVEETYTFDATSREEARQMAVREAKWDFDEIQDVELEFTEN